MALLQISEPGHSPAPHLRKRAAGIDLGTTHSLVATVRSGTPVALAMLMAKSLCLLPCVILPMAKHW
jgi:molecular chaperone HscA